MGLFAPWDNTYLNNCKLEELIIIALKPINILLKYKNWHPLHNLPQTCGGIKYICPVWIRPTNNFITQPKQVSGSINSDTIDMTHTSQQ